MHQSVQRWAESHAGVSCNLDVINTVFLKDWKIYLILSKERYEGGLHPRDQQGLG